MHPLANFKPRNRRRILLVFPKYAKSFGTFDHAFPLLGVRAFMPPQGILMIAALLPKEWELRFIDENLRQMTAADLEWADVVFLSGMHVQRVRINELNARAHKSGKITALGGPSVSSAQEFYPEVDLLHCGEAGDATLKIFQRLDESVERPKAQEIYRTTDRMPLTEFPSPRYDLLPRYQYLMGSIQFSSGCPFTCEFCDIPGLYGRNPRMKEPRQVLDEMDQILALGVDSVYFVDDNFIANPRAAQDLLPHLAQWQERNGYPLRIACEASLNISQHPQILALMQNAGFVTVFCGTETPEPAALRAMKKTQNLRRPILETIQTLNRYGLEVASGIILGLDTDTPETPQAILDFASDSKIPLMTVNLLYALPHTPLYDRLKREGRLLNDPNADSNIAFRDPHQTVVDRWKRVVAGLYEPGKLYSRYMAQTRETYINRTPRFKTMRRVKARDIRRGAQIFSRIIWHVGVRADYRKEFWKMFFTQISKGEVEIIFHIAIVSHHLITYARQAVAGKMQPSHYSLQTPDEGDASGTSETRSTETVKEQSVGELAAAGR
jgi:radical SAM superfamily enzyme YgiQ (UPF0313 family)